jgi:tetratricopeptide (TPR) repeat protein
MEEYDEARKMATAVLEYAESVGDKALISESLESLAGQLTRLGRLPEALRYRERIEQINRSQGAHGALKFDLPNRADLLIRLGRGTEAVSVLDEVRAAMASGNPAYADRGRRIALYAALLASTAGRFADAEAAAREAIGPPSDKPDGTAIYALVLREHALAHVGRSREQPVQIAARLTGVSAAAIRRDLAYWVADTLLLRKDPTLALSVVTAELASPVLKDNVELRWRLNALADRAVRAGATPAQTVNYKAAADDDVRGLIAEWAGDATAYFARTDLAVLRQSR